MKAHRDAMPLYPTEAEIAVAVMGPARAKEWQEKARYLETQGLPLVNELMGGRHWEAVVEFFRTFSGISLGSPVDGAAKSTTINSRVRIVPYKPDGKENFDAAETQPSDRRRPRGSGHRERI